MNMKRRDFLKVLGFTSTSAAVGCSSESAKELIPYIIPPEDIVPGKAVFYATTCRECPAGCGLLAKNRDGRIIKVEGNPIHPVNRGAICARGQSSLQGLYNPDRIRGPMKRNPQGEFEDISWAQAEAELTGALKRISEKGRGANIAVVTPLITGTMKQLLGLWLQSMGSQQHLMYEALAYEPLRKANEIVFGVDGIPRYRLDKADFIISFGADFLETWLSPVEHARQFASYREIAGGEKKPFLYVGPRRSLTAANADHWLRVPPGCEYLVAVGILKVILDGGLMTDLPSPERSVIQSAIEGLTLKTITARTGVTEEMLNDLARKYAAAKKPLALASGLEGPDASGLQNAVAANLLCKLRAGTKETIDWHRLSSLSEAARAVELKGLSGRMTRGQVDILFIDDVNPSFTLPESWGFGESMEAVPLVVSFSGAIDETTRKAHLIMPTHSPLEAWGDYAPQKGVEGLLQPVMGPMFETRHLGDILLAVARRMGQGGRFPFTDFQEMLLEIWREKHHRDTGSSFTSFWHEAVKRGGLWSSEDPDDAEHPIQSLNFNFSPRVEAEKPSGGFHLVTYPTIQFFDGRGASRSWLQEMPDPLTQITWGSWVELHPEAAKRLGLERGDLVTLRSSHGSVDAPVYPYSGVEPETAAMPIGQGHEDFGRFAEGIPANPIRLLPSEPDPISGGVRWSVSAVSIEKKNEVAPVANTDGSLYQMGRGLAQSISMQAYQKAWKSGHKPHLRMPLPEGYDSKEDFYPPHRHVDYRWGMTVDLDRCIGCGACVVACYAENNLSVVGKELILQGREMSWIRVQRYFDRQTDAASFLPMLCQHCDNAPCEPVCPVYAPHHSVEGLNNQVYNRCIGTRYCSQNCPYKVRRFNWFNFTRPKPLNWQLNPDVTVRQKGVMEKCSFCIQRIVEAKNTARNENRKVRDGEVVPACAQTCPTGALIFGNLMDPKSRVSSVVKDPRAYQVNEHLNTKPAVIYLKKITQKLL